MVTLGPPYQGYLYAYPHKTAYRPLDPRPRLADVWAGEDRSSLFLYLHVPYCEMRCGFCNLFTRTGAPGGHVDAYLAQLRRQAERVAAAVPGARYARAAIGGGTPTFLDPRQLTELFDLLPGGVPTSVETSPATATPDRLAVLAERGATRISIGVQSFLDPEAHAAGRPQRRAEVDRALDAIRAAGTAALNIDLIYGITGQTVETWEQSLAAALRWEPEELYLYPLYVRPLTGLRRRGPDPEWDTQRLELYRYAAGRLTAAGYRQRSMRQFQRATAEESPEDYSCQDDGMVGLGCGARSYTRALHYSFDYAVGIRHVRGILDDYLTRPAEDFDMAEVGFALDEDEQRRRWLLKSLLRAEGLDAAAYAARFGSTVDEDFPGVPALREAGYVDAGHRLTAEGLAHSDAIGPWLVSAGVRAAMAGHVAR